MNDASSMTEHMTQSSNNAYHFRLTFHRHFSRHTKRMTIKSIACGITQDNIFLPHLSVLYLMNWRFDLARSYRHPFSQ